MCKLEKPARSSPIARPPAPAKRFTSTVSIRRDSHEPSRAASETHDDLRGIKPFPTKFHRVSEDFRVRRGRFEVASAVQEQGFFRLATCSLLAAPTISA